MKEGKSKFVNRPTKTGGKIYDKFFIYIPTKVATDSIFPFKSGDDVIVRIENGHLVIRKAEEGE